MRTYKYELYTLRAKTNLHVGAGDNNFGIIDNQVQRDTITKLPIINSSSLKGALREYFVDELPNIYPCTHPQEAEKLQEKNDKTFINLLFGSDPKSNETQAGVLKFLSAFLYAMPIRSDDKPYHLVTAPFILQLLKEMNDDLELNVDIPEVSTESAQKPLILEDEETTTYKMIEDEGAFKDLVLIEDELFLKLIDTLPFIPRNHLENGESKNLWYEEIVPRESRFFFCIGKPDKSLVDFKKYEKFIECFGKNLVDKIVQIGANASIGYGLSKIEKL